MSTQIKRLKLSGKEFVPITLQEAVVVNATNIPGLADLGITTLDKVLRLTLFSVTENLSNISNIETTLTDALTDINTTLLKKQDKLTAGNGISIEKVGDDLVISADISFEIYKVVDALPVASASCVNTIYLVPTTGVSDESQKDILEEYMCIRSSNGDYVWERLGRITAGVDLSEYIERISKLESDVADLQGAMAVTITATDVTTSTATGNKVVIVTYDIPENLYDSAIGALDDDMISENK